MITCATLSLPYYFWGSQYSVGGRGFQVLETHSLISGNRHQAFVKYSSWFIFPGIHSQDCVSVKHPVLMILTTPAWEANACWSFENSRKFMILTIFFKFPLFTCLSNYRILESVGESENFTITMSMCVKSIDLTLSPPCRIMNLVVQSPAHQLDHLLLIDCVVKFSIPAIPSFFFLPWILMLLPPPFV